MPLVPDGRSNEGALVALSKLLIKKALTARQIAAATGVTKVTAYRRVLALKERGVYVVEHSIRDGSTGPMAIAYQVME